MDIILATGLLLAAGVAITYLVLRNKFKDDERKENRTTADYPADELTEE